VRIDNYALGGSGSIFWGAGTVEKISVSNSPDGHSSSQGLNRLSIDRSGQTVSVTPGAALKISNGTVIADGDDPFTDTSTGAHVAVENNAALEIRTSDKSIATLSGTNPSATIDIASVFLTTQSSSDSTYAGGFRLSGGFRKDGIGTLQLTGDNSAFNGPVEVLNGTLIAANTTSSTGGNQLSIALGGTLAGNGRVTGPVQLAGILAPGEMPQPDSDHTLDTGALSLSDGAAFRFALGAVGAATNAKLRVAGNLALAQATLAISAATGFAAGEYVLIEYTGTLSGNAGDLTLIAMPAGFSGKLTHDAVTKTIRLQALVPPLSSIDTPAAGVFRPQSWSGQFAGTVADLSGQGVAHVEISLRAPGGNYWDGMAFGGSTEMWLDALYSSGAWSFDFPAGQLNGDGAYTVRVRATDNFDNLENPPAQRAFSIDSVSPQVTVTPLATSSASPALSGTVDDATASLAVTVNGNTFPATNAGNGQWSLAAGILPGMIAGAYDVAVVATDPAGNAGADTTLNELTITLPDIGVILLAPVTGPTTGGTLVTLSGTHLDLVTAVKFGGIDGAIQSTTASSVQVLTPVLSAGTVAVTVQSLSNTVTVANAFTYFNLPPTYTSVSPVRVSTLGGTAITITGGGFLPGANVQVSGKNATNIVFVSATTLTAVVPANPPGPAALTVVNPDSKAVSRPAALTYDQPPQTTQPMQLNASQPVAGSPVQLLYGFSDPEGASLTVSIDWGDGTAPGTNAFHTFISGGVYTLVVSATDGISTTVQTLTVNVASAPGTNPGGGNGGDGGGATPGTNALTLDSVSGFARFDANQKDALQIKGVFPTLPEGTDFSGMQGVIDLGGAVVSLPLSDKGKGKSSVGSLSLKLKFERDQATKLKRFAGGIIPFSFKAKGDFKNNWGDEGLTTESDGRNLSATFALSISLGTSSASASVATTVAAKAGKSAKFKFKRAR
jgi:autotransporter-associated beta strand protein